MDKIDISPKIKDESLYKIISLALGLSLAGVGIKDKEFLKLALGILFIFYYTYKKEIYLTADGVVYTYRGFLFNREEHIHKKDIDEVVIVKQRNQSTLFFVKEPIAKKVVVNNENLDDIMKFIDKRLKLSIIIKSEI